MRRAGPLIIGRYALYDELASGGMAAVYLGRLLGPVGFSRTVAIKRMHPHYAKEQEFVAMFIDEARLAARIRHPNVVPTVDVVQTDAELFLVMEYVHGEALSRLLRRSHAFGGPLDPRIAVAILIDTLHGLHAAHTATSEAGHPLDIVHRDISPQNIMVGVDGVARVFDFGIAKAKGRLHTTQDGAIKGKLAYMAPEQLSGKVVTPQADVYAAAVVLWEALAGRRMYEAEHEAQLVTQVLDGVKTAPSELNPSVSPALDQVVMQALSVDPSHRFPTAMAMASALEGLGPPALRGELAEWVRANGPSLSDRSRRVQDVEVDSAKLSPSADEGSGRVLEKTPPPQRDLDTFATSSHAAPGGGRATRERGRGPGAALALGAALLVGAGAAYVLVSRSPQPAAATAQEASSAPEVAPTSPSTIEVSLASAAPTSAPAPAALASSAAPAASSAPLMKPRSSLRPAASSPPAVSPPPVAPTATPACDPPFYFDFDGIKRPKPGCR
ncbi:MAG: serine/threonine protein kinase [Polyangiaceae bacterium]|nr:serine/threonine protein kinase [Polyangiaceae bacterium]